MQALPLSVGWTGRLSSDESRNQNTQYRVPVGWRGKMVSARCVRIEPAATLESEPLVVVGDTGTMLSSRDGVTWTIRALPDGGTANMACVIWTGSLWVAVGNVVAGTSIFISENGITWTQSAMIAGTDLRCLVWTGSIFVIAGIGGIVLTSPDAVTWTAQTSGTTDRFFAAATSGTLIVLTGLNGRIITSPDGVTWTSQTSGTANIIRGATWGASQFVVTGDLGLILTSPDGVTWTSRTSGIGSGLHAVAWWAGLYMAVGPAGVILTSTDGITWAPQTSGVTEIFDALIYDTNNSLWVVTGRNGSILTSPDGVTWTSQTSGVAVVGLTGVGSSYALGTALGALAVGDHTIATTLDGLAWSNRAISAVVGQDFYAVTRGLSKYVAVGKDGKTAISSDGLTWTYGSVGYTTLALFAVTFNGSIFLATGINGGVFTSPDGLAWTSRTSGVAVRLYGVVWGGGQFVAVGQTGVIITSPDGTTWTAQTSGVATQFNAVGYGQGKFWATGLVGVLLTSPDGVTWTANAAFLAVSPTAGYNAIAITADAVVAVGNGGQIASSLDGGTTWAVMNYDGSTTLTGVTWTGAQFLAVSLNSTVMRSVNGVQWLMVNNGLSNVLWAVLPWAAPQSKIPYVQIERAAGLRRGFNQSSSFYQITSPGGSVGTESLGTRLRRLVLRSAYKLGWLATSGDVFTVSLDKQKNDFVGDVLFEVQFIFGPVVES